MLITVVLVLRKKKKTALVRVILYIEFFFIVQNVIVRSLFVTEPRECGTMQDYW